MEVILMPAASEKKNRMIIIAIILFLFGLCIRLLYYSALDQILIYPDSAEYLITADRIRRLELHSTRVPIYPLFIVISQNLLFFLDSVTAVIFVQAIISSAAAVLLFIAAYKIFGSKIKAILFFLFWSVSVCVINWDFLVLTESITIVYMILLIFFFIVYMQKKKEAYSIIIYAICFALLFTKPFYIALPPVIAAIILILAKISGDWKRTAVITLISLTVMYLSVFAYSFANYKQTGYFGISNVSVINRFGKILQYGMYELEDNEKITAYIKQYMKDNEGELPIPVQFINDYDLNDNNYSEISEYVSKIIKEHPIVFLKETVKLVTKKLYKEEVFVDYNHVYNNDNYIKEWPVHLFKYVNDIEFINTFRFLLIILFIDIFFIIYSIVKKKKLAYFWLMAFLLVAYQFSMSVAGAHDEYHRLMAPSYVFIFLIIFKYIFVIADYASRLPGYLREKLSDSNN